MYGCWTGVGFSLEFYSSGFVGSQKVRLYFSAAAAVSCHISGHPATQSLVASGSSFMHCTYLHLQCLFAKTRNDTF